MAPGLLAQAAALAAVAGVLASAWAGGARQDASLALAGYLRRCGVAQEQAAAVLRAVCTTAGDEEHEKRIQALRDTYAADEGKHLTGLPTLADLAELERAASGPGEDGRPHGAARGADEPAGGERRPGASLTRVGATFQKTSWSAWSAEGGVYSWRSRPAPVAP